MIDTELRFSTGSEVQDERRVFSREVKVEGVKLTKERGFAVAQAVRDLDVAESVLRRRTREGEVDSRQTVPGHGQVKPEPQELTQPRREVARLKAERDILVKAAAYFARESI